MKRRAVRLHPQQEVRSGTPDADLQHKRFPLAEETEAGVQHSGADDW